MKQVLIPLVIALILILPGLAAQESITGGPYNVSFDLNSTTPFRVEGNGGEEAFAVTIDVPDHLAGVLVYQEDCVSFENVRTRLLSALEFAEAENVSLYTRWIDGQKGLLAVSTVPDGSRIFTASYPMYFGAYGAGASVLVVSDIPWEEGTQSLLQTLRVEYILMEDAMVNMTGVSPYGLPLETGLPRIDSDEAGIEEMEEMEEREAGIVEIEEGDAGIVEVEEGGAEVTEAGETETVVTEAEETGAVEMGVAVRSDLIYDGRVTFSDNTGESLNDAVVIMDAEDEADGAAAEYYYLEETFGEPGADWGQESQDVIVRMDRIYDRIGIMLSDGTERTLYFDITDFYGRSQDF